MARRLSFFLCLATVASACSHDCKSARDCDANQRCVSFACKNPSESLGLVGDSCAATSQCAGGLTCETNGFPNGVCTSVCASGATCTAGACAGLAVGAFCAPTCTADAQCRTGYGCCPSLGGVCVPTGACLPAACVRTIVTSSLSSTQVIPLGVHKVGDVVPFNVPAGTSSLTIVHQAQAAGLQVVFSNGDVWPNNAVPGQIKQPDGGLAYDDNDQKFFVKSSSDGGTDPSGLPSMYGLDSPSTAAFTIPNTTAGLNAGIEPGTWKFVVNDFAYECSAPGSGCKDGGTDTGTYDVSVLLKPAPSASFDVAFYIVGDTAATNGQPFNAAVALSGADPAVNRMVTRFKKIFSVAGITVTNVSWFDVSDADKARFGTHINADTTGPCDELDQMFTLSNAHPGNTINLFLVQSIAATPTGGGHVVGIDGTIPGPASLSGTVHSGAAVSLADLFHGVCTPTVDPMSCGADEVAFISAHESGHFLGLYHPTESQGVDYDPLTDTPKCPCALCADSQQRPRCDTQTGSNPVHMDGSLCVNPNGICGGGDYLMFWQLNSFSAGTVSPQQAQIMMRSPAMQ